MIQREAKKTNQFGTMIELRPHNQKAVDEITTKLLEGNKKILYTSGTGCGKSYVFMGMVERLQTEFDEFKKPFKLKVLYILPKHVIRDNLEDYDDYKKLDCKLDFRTYNYFTAKEKGDKAFKKYDLIVIDECHHLGADLYGNNIVNSMEKSDKLFLGLTATPVRDIDKIDVSEYFDARVDGLSVWDAIRTGLMPPFIYQLCQPEQDTKQLEKEYDHEIRAVVDYMDSAEAVYEIVSTSKRNKWICFFPDTKSIKDAMPTIEEIFEGYKILVLLSSLRNLEEVMKGIRENEKVVVLSVNIMLEGVHIDGITGIVLYRNVTSTIAFQQMIGRCCKIGNTIEPVIIDTSQSASKILAKLIRENKENVNSTYVPPTGSSGKDILKVGIGGAIEYDLNKVLRLIDRSFINEEKNKEMTKKAILKYKGFNGKENYKTYDELKNSGLDYLKFKACAELYHIKPETVWRYWKAS